MKFANLIMKNTISRNYGDDIQNYSIRLLYERMGVDYTDVVRITHQEMFTYDGDEFLILPINYPLFGFWEKLSPKIIPVYLGVALLDESVTGCLRFNEFAPIGCRDQRTYEICIEKGIPAYINGCMSLTLPQRDTTKEYKKVYIVDVCDELYEYIPEEIKKDACYKTHHYYNKELSEEEILAEYQEYSDNAKLVITSRLHCASPCVAYGIPVIYARKIFSKRSTWLSNIIPVYSEKDFNRIDWHPVAPNVEHIKDIMIQNAIERIQSAWDQNFKKCRLTEIFESEREKEAVAEDINYPAEYMNNHWDKNREIPYIIWGITQTSVSLYKYISANYPNAKLVGVIDLYRKSQFLGVLTGGLDLVDKYRDAVVFVTALAIKPMAEEYFSKMGKVNYVFCWEDKNHVIRGNDQL